MTIWLEWRIVSPSFLVGKMNKVGSLPYLENNPVQHIQYVQYIAYFITLSSSGDLGKSFQQCTICHLMFLYSVSVVLVTVGLRAQ